MIEVKVTGVEELMVRLRNIAVKVPDNARKVMHRGADRIVDEARLNAPVDTHDLENSIQKEVAYAGNRRLQIDITVGSALSGYDVDRYAVRVHENYEGMLVNGPGPGTLAKMAANPTRIIGSQFLTRAMEAEREKLGKAMIEAIQEASA